MKIGRPKKRRAKTPHVGVKILQRRRAGGIVYMGRWKDPLSRQWKEISLTKEGYTNDQKRIAWAKRKAAEIEKTRKRGPAVVATLKKAVEEYFTVRRDFRDNTREAYAYALQRLTSWAESKGVVFCYQLTPGLLADFHGHVSSLSRREAQAKQPRGARAQGTRLLSANSRNLVLRGCHTFLNHIRRLDLTPEISSDDIKDRLPYVRGERSLPRFLRPAEIRSLLDAAARHDAERFSLTRDEHNGDVPTGSTPRFNAIRPFVLTCLLSGMRFSEAAGLRWNEVDLENGEITLDAGRVKTKLGRVIRRKFSPMLWALLEKMKLRAGDAEFVFGALSRDKAEAARLRLIGKVKGSDPTRRARKGAGWHFGAPQFAWHDLRRTCGTYLANMPGANLKHVADYLGHTIALAESLYWGAVDVDPAAQNLEQAMGIEAAVGLAPMRLHRAGG